MPATHKILNEPSQVYFYHTRNLGSINLTQEEMKEQWKKFESGWGVIEGWLKMNEEGQKYMVGDKISFVDIVLASFLLWFKRCFDVDDWKKIEGWHGGRWAKLLADFKQYE